MAFGRGKKKEKKKGGKGLLGALGIEAEKAPSQDQEETRSRHETIVLVWKYIRDRVDKGSVEYLQTGNPSTLEEYVARPALDRIIEQLDQWRSQGLLWAQPDRSTRTNSKIEVVSEQLNSKKQPTLFVVRESFDDYSVLFSESGGQKQSDGKRRVIQAKVEVEDGQNYKLLSVIEVKGMTLD